MRGSDFNMDSSENMVNLTTNLVGQAINYSEISQTWDEDEYYKEAVGMNLFVFPGFRLWMLLGLIIAALLALSVLVFCFVRIRIPRTRRQIEAMARQRKISRKGWSSKDNSIATENGETKPLDNGTKISMHKLDVPKRTGDTSSERGEFSDRSERSEVSSYSQRSTSQRSEKTETSV